MTINLTYILKRLLSQVRCSLLVLPDCCFAGHISTNIFMPLRRNQSVHVIASSDHAQSSSSVRKSFTEALVQTLRNFRCGVDRRKPEPYTLARLCHQKGVTREGGNSVNPVPAKLNLSERETLVLEPNDRQVESLIDLHLLTYFSGLRDKLRAVNGYDFVRPHNRGGDYDVTIVKHTREAASVRREDIVWGRMDSVSRHCSVKVLILLTISVIEREGIKHDRKIQKLHVSLRNYRRFSRLPRCRILGQPKRHLRGHRILGTGWLHHL